MRYNYKFKKKAIELFYQVKLDLSYFLQLKPQLEHLTFSIKIFLLKIYISRKIKS